MTESVAGGAVRVVAVPVSSGAATALVEIRSASGLKMNSDGSTVAVSLSTSPQTARIAVWNPASGASHWVTPADDLLATDPAWSADGRHIFFARSRVTPGGPPESLGIWRVLSDGTGEEQVMAPVRDVGLGITLRAVTPDGRGLVWGKLGLEGASLEVYDQVTRTSVSFGCCLARIASFRTDQPRALVLHYTGDGFSELVLWDDASGNRVRRLAEMEARVRAAAWGPDGQELVAALMTNGAPAIVRMNADGTRRQVLLRQRATELQWMTSAIVLVTGDDDSATRVDLFDIRTAQVQTRYSGGPLFGLTIVK